MEGVIRTAIADTLQELGLPEADFSVEHPGDFAHGDYASNVALVVAKGAGQAPRHVAEQLVAALEGQIEYVDRIEIAGPGFINFFLARDFFQEEITRSRALCKDWGKNKTWAGKKVIVEYTDPNPFKEFHIGHLFTNTVGESISRLFTVASAEVKRANWQGDVGMHVACAIYGMQELGLGGDDISVQELGKAYAFGATARKENDKAKAKITAINKAVYERSDEAINALYDKGRTVSLAYFESMYALLDTKFDGYFFEGQAAGLATEIVTSHPNVFAESDGARVFVGEEYGLHTRVFLNSEGLPTYEAKELALAKMKDEFFDGYDYSVISTSNEITEYFKVLLKVMSFIYPELAKKTEHIGHGTVRLSTGKMSSRTGDVISALDFISDIADAAKAKMNESGVVVANDELANDIAIGAIRYATLKANILQDSVFDKTKALSFEGDSGPYLQYTHARICSVLEKAKEVGVEPSIANAPEQPYVVEKVLYQFPEVVLRALEERAPHHVAHYLTELAGAFNTFYAEEKIADPNDEFSSYKAAIADAVRITLKNGLWILGIKAPEQM